MNSFKVTYQPQEEVDNCFDLCLRCAENNFAFAIGTEKLQYQGSLNRMKYIG